MFGIFVIWNLKITISLKYRQEMVFSLPTYKQNKDMLLYTSVLKKWKQWMCLSAICSLKIQFLWIACFIVSQIFRNYIKHINYSIVYCFYYMLAILYSPRASLPYHSIRSLMRLVNAVTWFVWLEGARDNGIRAVYHSQS